MMNDEPLRAWAVQVLQRELERNTPAAKLKRELAAAKSAGKKEYLKKKRALSTQHSARIRAIRKEESERQADMDRRRWELLTR